jgi:hypothetical protein
MTMSETELQAESSEDLLNELQCSSGFVAMREGRFWGDIQILRHRRNGDYYVSAQSVERDLAEEGVLQGPFDRWATAMGCAVLLALAELWEAKAQVRALRAA